MIHKLLNLTRPLFVVDCETTGVDPKTDRIVELGFQRWEAAGMTKEWRTLVNPGVPIPAAASRVHGIYDLDVRGRCQECKLIVDDVAPDRCRCEKPRLTLLFGRMAANLAKGFSDCDFAGKNVRFDLRILAAEMKRAGVEWSYEGARIVDVDRLEQLAVPRDLGSMHAKYVRTPCDECDGKGKYLDAPANVLDGHPYEVTCHACNGVGTIGKPHDGAHGALSDVQASTRVIVGQLEAHASLPRDLDLLHAKQWPGWIDPDGKFRFVDGVPCFAGWGKHAGKPMRSAEKGYWDFILNNDFGADVKALASAAKLGKFPEAKK